MKKFMARETTCPASYLNLSSSTEERDEAPLELEDRCVCCVARPLALVGGVEGTWGLEPDAVLRLLVLLSSEEDGSPWEEARTTTWRRTREDADDLKWGNFTSKQAALRWWQHWDDEAAVGRADVEPLRPPSNEDRTIDAISSYFND
jgi:hypothetical protein